MNIARKLAHAVPTAAAAALWLLATPAAAALVSSEQAASLERAGDDRARVEAFLAREDVERQLKALGVSPELARQRAGALTDAEIATIAGKLDRMPAGGALSTNDLILVLLIAVLVLLLI